MNAAPPPVDLAGLYSDASQLAGLLIAAQELVDGLKIVPEVSRQFPCIDPGRARALDALITTARQQAEKIENGLDF